MLRTSLLVFVALCSCHGYFGGRTTDDDQELNNFAEARLRAASYYDGRDFERAAAQYSAALEYKPDHVPTRLGYAYSLMFTQVGKKLIEARDEFEDMGELDNPTLEVKRIFGMAMTHRSLAKIYQGQAIVHDKKGMLDWLAKDRRFANDHADQSLKLFQEVIDFDEEMARKQEIGPLRTTASLTPDCHVGMAHCYIIKSDRQHSEPLEDAVKHIQIFSATAAKARRFWTERRQRILATDPLRDGERGNADPTSVRGLERRQYERRILRTVDEESAMRRAMVEIYMQLSRYDDVIAECDTILQLDRSYHQIYWVRGQAYASLTPPDYKAAIKDVEEYRRRTFKGGLTEELVRVNRWIERYKRLQEKQQAAAKTG